MSSGCPQGCAQGMRRTRIYHPSMSISFLPTDYAPPVAHPDDEIAKLRTPPHSVEAEQSVLGGLLLDNSAWDRAGDLLVDSDFYRYEHRFIYAAIGGLIGAT